MSKDRCIKNIIDETGTKLTKRQVEEIMDMMIDMDLHPRKNKAYGPFSPEQGRVMEGIEKASMGNIARARDILMARARLVAEKQIANKIMDATKREDRFATYNAAPTVAEGIQAKLVGSNTPFFGNRNSADATIQGLFHDLAGTFDRELKGAGLDKLYASRAVEEHWVRELYELNKEGGTPGISKNKNALGIATAIRNLQQRIMDAMNKEGAFIGKYDGYIAKSTHSSYRLGKMGVDAWVDLALKTFDIKMMYPNQTPEFIRSSLQKQYGRIRSGLHSSYDPAELDLIPTGMNQNLAERLSESRKIHFKDADSWLEYIAQASDKNPTQIIMESALMASRHAGLMRVFGTNPKRALETDLKVAMERARDAGDFDTVEKIKNKTRAYNLWMSYMTGEANGAHNRTAAAITSAVLSVQRLAKLGFLPIAQLVDVSNGISELRYQGIDFIDRMTGGVTTYFRGAEGSDKRVVADLLNAYVEGEMQGLGVMIETGDPTISGGLTGKLNKIQRLFFKYTGATAMTNRARGSVAYMMARHLGSFHGQKWAALGEHEQRIMTAFGITEKEWDVLSTADFTTGNEGKRYLTPDNAHTIPDSVLDNYRKATNQEALTNAEIRDDLASKLYTYYADRMDYGVLQPRSREHAILYQGRPADDPLGIALRLATQFKSFMVSQFTRTWGREIYGQSGLDSVYGLVEFATIATALGVVANAANQLAKGQDPFSQWEKEPGKAIISGFLRSGSGSMAGDFIFGEFDRHGMSAAGYMLGPTVGSLEVALRAYNKAKSGENPSGDALYFARSITPLTNSIYTHLATNYLLWNGLTEMANPGYNRRRERKLEKDQGIKYLKGLAPSEFRAF